MAAALAGSPGGPTPNASHRSTWDRSMAVAPPQRPRQPPAVAGPLRDARRAVVCRYGGTAATNAAAVATAMPPAAAASAAAASAAACHQSRMGERWPLPPPTVATVAAAEAVGGDASGDASGGGGMPASAAGAQQHWRWCCLAAVASISGRLLPTLLLRCLPRRCSRPPLRPLPPPLM